MAVLEYLTGNSLVTYPFKDGLKLKAVDSYVLANDVLLDALIVSKDRTKTRAYLKTVSNTTFQIAYTDGTTEVVDSVTITGATPFVTITHSSSNGFIKLVPGSGLNTLGSHTFTLDNTEFSTSVVLAKTPSVSSISYYNYTPTGDTLVLEGAPYTDAECFIEEGYNLSFAKSNNGNSCELSVIPKSGAGLLPCPTITPGSEITTINGIGPDKFGNFNIYTDACYSTIPHTHGLEFDHTCTPKCTSDQLQAYGHYLNRVKDGMIQLAGRVNQIGTYLIDQVTSYEAYLAAQIAANNNATPSLHTKYIITSSDDTHFISFACGIYNPREHPLTDLSLSITHPNPLTYLNGTAKVDNKETFIPISPSSQLNITSSNHISVSCHDSVIYNFVLTVPATNSTAGPVTIVLSASGISPVTEVVSLTLPPPLTTTTTTTSTTTTSTTTTTTTTTSTTTTSTTTTTTTSTTTAPPDNFAINKLININFGGTAVSPISGFPAELSSVPAEFWNNINNYPGLTASYSSSNTPANALLYSDGVASSTTMTWAVTPSTAETGAAQYTIPGSTLNPMYATCISVYNITSGQGNPTIKLKFSNLTPGHYDLVVYAHGVDQYKNCKITVLTGPPGAGGIIISSGPSPSPGTTTTDATWNLPGLTINKHFVRYNSIDIASTGHHLDIILEQSSTVGYTAINGLQLKRVS